MLTNHTILTDIDDQMIDATISGDEGDSKLNGLLVI